MSRFPSMPLFIDAYLADTTHFSAEEHGAYLLLLMAMWRRNGHVPNDDRDLARMCCCHRSRWPRIKARLMPMLLEKDGELSQKKLNGVLTDLKNKKTQKTFIKSGGPNEQKQEVAADSRARAVTITKKKDLLWVAPSFPARENGNGSALQADGALGLEGRAPQPNGRAPPPDKEWPPPSHLIGKVYPNGKAAAKQSTKPGNGTQPGRHRRRKSATAPPGRAAEDHARTEKSTEAETPHPRRS